MKNMGTVMITLVGMLGRINGWVGPSVFVRCFAVVSIVKKPGVIEKNIEIREYLYMTVLVDHDVIDGAPAVRARSKLTKLVEGGFGLRFMIADFTGHRGGVYFEAGFAHGLGIPVIWTCREDQL